MDPYALLHMAFPNLVAHNLNRRHVYIRMVFATKRRVIHDPPVIIQHDKQSDAPRQINRATDELACHPSMPPTCVICQHGTYTALRTATHNADRPSHLLMTNHRLPKTELARCLYPAANAAHRGHHDLLQRGAGLLTRNLPGWPDQHQSTKRLESRVSWHCCDIGPQQEAQLQGHSHVRGRACRVTPQSPPRRCAGLRASGRPAWAGRWLLIYQFRYWNNHSLVLRGTSSARHGCRQLHTDGGIQQASAGARPGQSCWFGGRERGLLISRSCGDLPMLCPTCDAYPLGTKHG